MSKRFYEVSPSEQRLLCSQVKDQLFEGMGNHHANWAIKSINLIDPGMEIVMVRDPKAREQHHVSVQIHYTGSTSGAPNPKGAK
jgi:hypothetical protein